MIGYKWKDKRSIQLWNCLPWHWFSEGTCCQLLTITICKLPAGPLVNSFYILADWSFALMLEGYMSICCMTVVLNDYDMSVLADGCVLCS